MFTENKKFKKKVKAISIVDEYLEHARVMIFHHDGKERVFISSADWMVRNLDHRVEAACPIVDKEIQQELKDILNIQLSDNVKARILDNELSNEYVQNGERKKNTSQIEIYNYLLKKKYTLLKLAAIDIGSNAARLLISEVIIDDKKNPSFNKISLVRVPLRLGFDVFDSGEISDKKVKLLVYTMKAYINLLQCL